MKESITKLEKTSTFKRLKGIKWYYSATVIGIALVIVVGIIYIFNKPTIVEAGWFNEGWAYRQTVSITNGGTAQTDFQVKIILDSAALITAGKVQSDCDDIRITDTGGNILPHWIENSTCNTATTYIWTKVPSISTSGAIVYLYYGNTSSSNIEDGDSVFEFFDDFSRSSVDTIKWSNNGVTLSGGVATIASTTVARGNYLINKTSFAKAVGYTVDIRYKAANTNPSDGETILGWSTNSSGFTNGAFNYYNSGTSLYFYLDTGYQSGTTVSNAATEYHNYQTTITSSSSIGQLDGVAWTTQAASSEINMYIKINPYKGGGYVDWVFVRKYAATELVVATPASEEKGPGPIAYWKFDEGHGSTTYDNANQSNYIRSATGGTITEVDGYRIHTFTSSGTFMPTTSGNVEVLVVAGGGGGGVGSNGGAGGGAGGLIYKDLHAVDASAISVTVGAGGNGSTGRGIGTSGANSVFDSLTAIGGGRGGGWGAGLTSGVTGGSGGGGAYPAAGALGTSEQGKSGGDGAAYLGLPASTDSGGGGGGAGERGEDGKGSSLGAGAGGDGLSYDISGTSTYYAGGGAGATNNMNTRALGGLGGGGDGGTPISMNGDAGTANTGGGGGGGNGGGGNSGAGGSGVVIIRYPINNDGTISGATWQTEDMCISGKCLYFDGATDYMETSGDEMNLSEYVGTLEMWARPVNLTTTEQLFYTYENRDRHVYTESGAFKVAMYDGGASTFRILSGGTVDGRWHHLAFIWDINNGNEYFYIDGVLVDSYNGASWTTAIAIAPTKYGAGTTTNVNLPTTSDYMGFIDEPKIYNYARTAAQIKADYLAGQAGLSESATASFGSGAPANKSLSEGLVGYWKMDETSGNVADSSGNGNTGTVTGTTVVAGKYGNGRDFNGASYVDIGDKDLITNSGTWSAWIYMDDLNTNAIVTKWENAGTVEWWFGQYAGDGDEIHLAFSSGFNGYKPYYSVGAGLVAAQWYYLTATYDGDFVKFYKNGQYVSSVDAYNGTVINGTANVLIGAQNDGAAATINGKLDEVRIYNRALSAKEVRDLYNWAPGPVAYYNFDEGTGTTLNDVSGNGYSSTSFSGSPTWTSGKYGGALEFDGSGDYVTSTDTIIDSIKDSMTIGLWFKTSTSQGNRPLVATQGTGNGMVVRTDTSGTNKIQWQICDTACHLTTSSSSLNDSLWHYMVGTSDGTNVVLYIDGVVVDSVATQTGDINKPGNGLEIGTYAPAASFGSNRFSGKIDDLKIYNYVRTTKQIVSDMNAGHPAGGSPVASQLGYWKFDEGYGDTAYDSGFGDNDGNLEGVCPGAATCPSWTNDGKIGKALSFDGGDYLTISNILGSTANTPFTATAWIYPNAIDSWRTIIGDGCDGFDMVIVSGYFKVGENCGVDGYWYSGPAVTTGQWYHVAAVFNGSNVGGYVDGVYFAGGAASYVHTGINIGSYSTSGAEFFNGIIDEVKIYNYALTADEVLIDMNQGASSVMGNLGTDSSGNPDNSASRAYCVPGDTSTCNPPIAEWKFDEKTGTTAYDTSNNNYIGTITNATWTRGKIGSALSFDRSGDYVSMSRFTVPVGVSISAWMKTTNTDSTASYAGDAALNIVGDSTGGIFLGFGVHGGKIRYNHYAGGWQSVTGTTTVNDGMWHYLSVTHNQSSGAIVVYVNGKVDATGTITYTTNSGIDRIGAGYNINDLFEGSIDDVKIYDYARTQAQIAWDFNRGAPVGWWKFDECEGTTAYDWAPSGDGYRGNDATINIGGTGTQTAVGTCETSGTAWGNGATGQRNGSMNFDGTDDYVQVIADGSSTYNFQEYSIAAWFKSDTDPDTASQVIWSYDYISHNGPYYSQHLRVGGSSVISDEIEFYWNDGSTYRGITADGALTGTQTDWHHVVATFKSGAQKLYLDGVEVASDTRNDTITYYAQEVWIGKANFGAFFDGKLDDVRIYNYTLTSQQVQNVMNDGAVKF